VIGPDLTARVGARADDVVLLRAWQPGDLPVIAEATRDPYIPLVTTIPVRYTTGEGDAWLRRQREQAAAGYGCPLAIVVLDTGEVAGMATVTGIDWTHYRANVGYWVLPRLRGRGYATAAVSLLPEMAAEWGLIRLQALVETSNHASRRVCRSAGFVEEGVLRRYQRIGDRNRDMVIYARVLRAT